MSVFGGIVPELVVGSCVRRVASFVNQHGALETHYFLAILIHTSSGDGHCVGLLFESRLDRMVDSA